MRFFCYNSGTAIVYTSGCHQLAFLQKIGEGLPDNIQHRYDDLQRKLLVAQLTGDEHEELLNLIDLAEQADADRLQALIELAQLRAVTLDQVINQLGIHPPPAYV